MALFNNVGFKMLEKGLDATWYKQKVIGQNIANANTPGYKAKQVNFESVLDQKCKCAYHLPKEERNGEIDLKVSVTSEPNTNQTIDENNVDAEKENVALADAQLQYSMLIDKANNEFSMIRTALQR
ncbi:MAG: flagellar basal body rod protein FlgB [Oscillospiraceae bacterium]